MPNAQTRAATRPRRVLFLRSRLLFATAALATLASLSVGIITVGALQRGLADQIDTQLEQAFVRAAHVIVGIGPTSVLSLTEPLDATIVLQGPAQAPGTLAVVLSAGQLTGGTIGEAGEVLPLPREMLDRLVGLPLDGTKHTVSLGQDPGNYRLVAGDAGGATVVIGLPLARAEATITGIAWTVAVSTVVAVAALIMLGSLIIRRSLRPLETLAHTADEVARRELAVGEDVALDRIDLADVDPHSEVGRVLTAYNRMVGNVEGALREREEGEQRTRRFVADASHELRTPLASIRGYSEFLRRLDTDDLPSDIVHSIARIEAESLRMQALVEDLLLLTRISQGQELRLQAVDVIDTLRNAIADATITDSLRHWELQGVSQTGNEAVMVFADPLRLHQVVVNLLSNARSHTPPGSRVDVRVIVDRVTSRAIVEVTDNGPGIPPNLLPHVFERFVRGDAQRVRGGTGDGGSGLGLPIAAALMHAFGGDIHASGGPEGATITLELRLV